MKRIDGCVYISEAIKDLGVSRRTIHYWISSGKLRTRKSAGRERFIPLKEIARLLKEMGN